MKVHDQENLKSEILECYSLGAWRDQPPGERKNNGKHLLIYGTI